MKVITPDWPAPNNIKAFCSTRDGGVSNDCYASLNLGDHVADQADHVSENRQRLAVQLELPNEPAWLQQKHTNIVVNNAEVQASTIADASYTSDVNSVCVIMTADCLPILICDRNGTKVAAIHSGWRSLAADIIERTLEKLATPSKDLLVWLGPAISKNKYEVGAEVYTQFVERNAEDANGFSPSHRAQHYYADLYQLARNRCQRAGITAIYGGEFCTYTDKDRFFSYRRDGQTGRIASLIWITA